MFDVTNIVKNGDGEKYVYSGCYEIVFDGKEEWNFGNNFARNIVIFGFDNSWSSCTDNDFLVLGESVNGSFVAPEKCSVICLLTEKDL